MARTRKSLIWSLGALAIMGTLWGCNGTDIDDEEVSDSLLIVDTVEPPNLQSDVSPNLIDPLDPNSPTTPPEDDVVKVKVRNLNRSQSPTGIFGDIQINTFDLICGDSSLNERNAAVSVTVPAEASATISVSLLTGATKAANQVALLAIGSTRCGITFNGQDLSGEPILSQEAIFVYSFISTP